MTDDLSRRLRELPPRLDVPADFFDRVMDTVRRRRRAKVAGSSAIALVVAVVGIVLAVTASGGTDTERIVPIGPPVTSVTPSPLPSTTPSPAPSSSPSAPAASTGLIPLSVSFVTPQLGWAYGPAQAPNGSLFPPSAPGALAITHDRGEHWSMLPSPHVSYGAPGGAKSVLFIDANRGYLYGDGLFATTDGGAHWRRIPAPGSISQLAATSSALYVMAMTCPASTPLCGTYDLYAGQLNGTVFSRTGSVTDTANAQLSASGSRVYVLWSPNVTTGPAHLGVSTSSDTAHWASYATPCVALGADDGSIAAFSDAGLALVCGNSASAGIQGKSAYLSTDGGVSWTARGTPTSLPLAGYVGPLAAADANTWVLAEQRGGLLVTHDSGNSWQTARQAALAQAPDEWGQVTFTGPQHAVAVPGTYYANGLLISGDSGDSWSAVTFPP
jgi:hypothetical protein